MIEFMKNWVITISVCVFFIIAVESILPSNDLKKYAKFVLGLILIITIINPIIKIINGNLNITSAINMDKYTEDKLYKNTYEEYKNKNIESTCKNFEYNLEKQCMNKLKEKYSDNNFKIAVKVKYQEDTNSFKIMSMNVGVKKHKVVEKVVINTKREPKSKEKVEDKLDKEIKNYINKEFEIPINVINIYKI
ncbi:stage III sporulation protein AF [Haloimpatiens lingqiaonensis]|uniref:stage III sporulation protein AF n=1 Tax=Haloimpatiens lingqiaonensis TaxID=1380675 RepID=UPI0010FD73D7|nr:stage III sporulation protein AF [Haloimpatiens lingqiaonensis]